MLRDKRYLTTRQAIRRRSLYFLAYFLPMFAAVIIAGLLFYHKWSASRWKRFASNEFHNVSLTRDIISSDFRDAVHALYDLRLLLAPTALQDAERAVPWRRFLRSGYATEVLELAKTKRLYRHVHVFDRAGREHARVNSLTETSRLTSVQSADVGSKYYFRKIVQLDSGRVYVSPVDATVEHRQVVLPPNPVIHLGVAAFGHDGKRTGCVLVDFSLSKLFADLKSSDAQFAGRVMLFEPPGYPVYGQWNSVARDSLSWQNRRPPGPLTGKGWRRVAARESGQFVSGENLVTFATVRLGRKQRSLLRPGSRIGKSATPAAGEGYWKIVSFAPRSVVSLGQRQILMRILQICGVILLALGVWSGLLAHALVGREEVAKSLKNSQEKYRRYLAAAPIGVFVADRSGKYSMANEAFCRLIGYEADELLGKEIGSLTAPQDQSLVASATGDFLRTGRLDAEVPILTKSGERRTWAIHGVRISRRRFLGYAIDVTERLHTQQALLESEAKWRSLVKNAPNFIAIVGPDFAIQFLNRPYLGHAVEDVVGRSVFDFIAPEYHALARERVERVLHTGENVSYESVDRSGDSAVHWFENYVGPVKEGNRIVAVMYIFSEVTQRKQMEKSLRQSEFFLRESQRVSRIGSFVLDTRSGLISTSRALDVIFGVDTDYQHSMAAWLGRVHPADREEMELYLKHQVLAGKLPFDHEYRIFRVNDNEVRWVHGIGRVEFSDIGGPLRMIGTVQDITERKQEEEKRAVLVEQLHHAQKLDTIGTLAGGVAHDFNNILQAIHGYVSLSLEAVSPGSQLCDDLQQVMRATQRAIDLVRQVLTFSRHDLQDRQPVQLQFIVKEALGLLRPALPSSIEVRTTVDESCESVLANPGQMHQIMMNLCTNASQAMGDHGVLTVTLEPVRNTETETLSPGLIAGKCVRLTVGDTGSGMDSETASHIFEPFFTTKAVGEGTGLGLSVVHGIVETHGGDITVETAPGAGTTFYVTLPVYSVSIVQGAEAPDASYTGSETILVVEDDLLVSKVVERLLSKAGYDVVSRNDSLAALKTFAAEPGKFDLVLTDQTMPKMVGTELAVELRKVRADIPIILMSGFGHQAATADAVEVFDELVSKPVQARELGRSIRRVLRMHREVEV